MSENGEQRAESRRLFVALPLPPSVIRHLTSLPHRGLDANWQQPDDLHITVRFLGEVSAAQEAAVIGALQTVQRPAFGIEMQGLDVFQTGRQHILHAPIVSTRKLTTLCTEITDALTPLGFDFGHRPYIPHITLARLNHARGLDDYIARHGAGLRGQWQATQFHLYESAGSSSGRRYTPRGTFLLR